MLRILVLLDSTAFRLKIESCHESQPFWSIEVYSFDDEFLEDWILWRIREKFWKALTQGDGGDKLGRREVGSNSSEPRPEGREHQFREGSGEVLQEALGDQSSLHKSVVCVHFSLNRPPILLRFFMNMLITGESLYRFHSFHPEMVGISSHGSDGLFEGHFDLESEPIETNDFKGWQRQVRWHQDTFSPGRMKNRHETNHNPHRAPDQINRDIAELA